ncbi:MAG: DUF4919 domain-containing protein [Patescibacteria group bacterium]|nr:DUF4919 domain-containing protein [Patescibacteria group bacterium]
MTSLKNQAIYTALNGDWEKAITLNKTLVKDNPNDIDALNRLAFAFSILGKTKDAKIIYKKVLGIDALNPLALRNLKKISGDKESKNSIKKDSTSINVSNAFLEEPGKTKVVEVINIAQPAIISRLRTGQSLSLSVKRFKIFLLAGSKQYVGMLPDNIGTRLIKFIKAGNLYEAFVKSASNYHLIVFIKETKRSSHLKDQPSFISGAEKTLEFNKRVKSRQKDRTEKEEKDYDEEDDES